MKPEKFMVKLCDGTKVYQTHDEFRTYFALLKEIHASAQGIKKDFYDENGLINNIQYVSAYNDGAECVLLCNRNTFNRMKSDGCHDCNYTKWNGCNLIVTEELNGKVVEDRTVHILPNGGTDRKSEYNIYRF